MTTPNHLPKSIQPIWVEQSQKIEPELFTRSVAGPDFDAYCALIDYQRQVLKAIDTDGVIVADAKGDPIANPAVALLSSITKNLATLRKTLNL